ncbi:hypothetical protein Tco_0971850 [Tanacetum coccineum]
MVAYLQKSKGSEGFHQIIDFLNTSHIQYALTENPTIYVSFIKQFWKTATARTSANGEVELTTTIDGQVKTITEASLRRHLKLEDNGGITTLPNSEIFEQLALMGDPAVLRYHAQLNRPYSVAEVWDQIQSFAPMDSEKEKGSEKKGSRKKSLAKKRAGEKQSEESTKRQKIEDDIEKEELKAYLDLVPREEIPMEIESLATKYPIVDWKTHVLTENFMYYQIIRADGGSKNYKIFSKMLDDFDRQGGDLKILFQLEEEDEVWRHQHEYNLLSWRLFDSCGIHILLMDNGIAIYMMIEKKYPLTQEMLSKMLSRKLEVDHESTMAYELLRFIRSQVQK